MLLNNTAFILCILFNIIYVSAKSIPKNDDKIISQSHNLVGDIVSPYNSGEGKTDEETYLAKSKKKKSNDNDNSQVTTNAKQICVYKYHTEQKVRALTDGASYDGDDELDYEEYVDREPILTNETVPEIGTIEVEHCAPHTDFCYAFWVEDHNGQITILGQGCWESSDKQNVCGSSECRTDRSSPRSNRPTKFCCCKSSLCNASPVSFSSSSNSTVISATDIAANPSVDNFPLGYGNIVTIVGACLTGLLMFIVAFKIFKYTVKGKQLSVETRDPGNNIETGGPGFSCSTTCVDNLKLHDNIGSGKYAKVWRGSLGAMPVAVKALPSSQYALWARERDLYCMPHMKHSNLLQYLGCDTRPTFEGPPEHLLVLQLAPLGSLRSYLIDHTLDWETYTNMALGVASALAHLHTHIDKDGQYKPCIVHRDINSTNIMVRADLSCCIGDLGLAMPLPDNKSQVLQPNYRIQEAGTLRYLAPEALEGSLDLRRCAASLRAVDVYALSLVLWELLSRCMTLHRAPGPLPYALPYETEVGNQPTLERMQVVVARHKSRPLFSPRLLSVRATRLARDTCEDCWDHDAEARLTAVCVVERLTELKNMKPASSPTINSNNLRPPSQNQDGGTNWHSPGSCEDKNSNVTSNLIDFQANILNKMPLQPHQGRNPCLERNLVVVSENESEKMIDKSFKDMPQNVSLSLSNHGSNNYIRPEQVNPEQSIRNLPQDFSRIEEQTIPRNANRAANQNVNLQTNHNDNLSDDQLLSDFRQLTRPVTPIGYVQNDVSGDLNGIVQSHSENPYGYPAKRSNIKQDVSQPRWSSKRFKDFFGSKIFKRKNSQSKPVPLETEVNLVLSNGKPINNGLIDSNGRFKTSIIEANKLNRDDSVRNNDRPSSLPGLDSVASNDTDMTDLSVKESNIRVDLNQIKLQNDRIHNENTTCTLSPPNRTVPQCSVSGFRELPNNASTSKQNNQVFAVIVPKTSSNNSERNSLIRDKNLDANYHTNKLYTNDITTNKIFKIDDKLLMSDDKKNNVTIPKRYSCDSNILSERDSVRNQYNRSSYSGEYETANVNEVDYSSNSEDEHMLLLSENGGSKITMRQRYDVPKKNRPLSASLPLQESGSGISKIATESISSICGRYGAKGKYENLQNDNAIIKNRKLSLSICKQSDEDVSILDLNGPSKPPNTKNDDTSSGDETYTDEVFAKKNSNSFRPLSIKHNLSRQHSLELVSELFSSSADLTRLKDPASRIKTPGDVPPSVRRMRGSLGNSRVRRTASTKGASKTSSNRLSLYDDRMMFGNSL